MESLATLRSESRSESNQGEGEGDVDLFLFVERERSTWFILLGELAGNWVIATTVMMLYSRRHGKSPSLCCYIYCLLHCHEKFGTDKAVRLGRKKVSAIQPIHTKYVYPTEGETKR